MKLPRKLIHVKYPNFTPSTKLYSREMYFSPKPPSPTVRGGKVYIYLRIFTSTEEFFYFFRFSATIYPTEARFKAKAPVITIEVVQNLKEQPETSKIAIPKPEEIEDISFLRSGKCLNISFDLKQTNA